ncbi:hypothetical protein MBLNU457_3812t1 [Dothideomycetes sp. NU457]
MKHYMQKLFLVIAALLVVDVLSARTRSKGSNTIHVRRGASIQAAIDDAPDGARIEVEQGVYKGPIVISKNGISLIGHNAQIIPPDTWPVEDDTWSYEYNCADFAGIGTRAGICISGRGFSFGDLTDHRKVLEVKYPVQDVTVTGFEVKGFSGPNIAVVGAKNARVSKNTLLESPTYGCITAGSINSQITDNKVRSSNLEFVIGICMDDFAPATVSNNDISGYRIGLCMQTDKALVQFNRVSGHCFGAFVDPGVNGAQLIKNEFRDLNNTCPGNAGSSGIFITGASNTEVRKNKIHGMLLPDGTGAGIVLIDGFQNGTPLSNGNNVQNNQLFDNNLDIFLSSNGLNNVFTKNKCTASFPPELCTNPPAED